MLGDYINSWEYTADGHAMALWAGADLIDMEFVQFHPTGMVWPPSVRGTLITEGVRGEGGVLLNGERKRFMFGYIPDRYKGEFAETEEEATKWVQAVIAGKRPEARRPPELLTRDVVARAIRRRCAPGAGRRTGACIWISRRGGRRRRSSGSCRACITSSRSWRMWILRRSRWRWGRRATT